jgi:Fe-Mn family superoxide dismutase
VDKKEVSGNLDVVKDGSLSRRDVLMMGLAASSVAAIGVGLKAQAAEVPTVVKVIGKEPYQAKDYSHLLKANMIGLSAAQIEPHLKLYKGYVTKSNEIYTKLKEVDLVSANASYSPLRELLLEESFAFNGMVYHEYYFGNLGGKGGEPTGELKSALDERFGSTGKFLDFLKASGKSMRGWVVVGWNLRGGHIDTFGLDTHNMWSPQSVIPILVLDVYEHAYMIDYGIDRPKYLDAFTGNLDWNVVAKRLATAVKHQGGSLITA